MQYRICIGYKTNDITNTIGDSKVNPANKEKTMGEKKRNGFSGIRKSKKPVHKEASLDAPIPLNRCI
jgi:hypothetical protein